VLAGDGQAFAAVPRFAHLVTGARKQDLQQLAIVVVIVGNKDGISHKMRKNSVVDL